MVTVLVCAAIASAVFYFGIRPNIQQKAKDEAVSKYDSVYKSGQIAQRIEDSIKVDIPLLDSIKIVNLYWTPFFTHESCIQYCMLAKLF